MNGIIIGTFQFVIVFVLMILQIQVSSADEVVQQSNNQLEASLEKNKDNSFKDTNITQCEKKGSGKQVMVSQASLPDRLGSLSYHFQNIIT